LFDEEHSCGRDGDVSVAAAKHLSEQPRRVGMRKGVFEHRAEADQVDEHRLPVATVAALAGMLGHVGVDHHAVCGRVAKALRLVGLQLAECLPATRGAWDVFVHRSVDIGHQGAAARTRCRLSHASVSVGFTAKTVPPRRTSHIVSDDDLSSYQSRTPVTPRTTAVVRAAGAKSAASRHQINPRVDDKRARH
jgi:hypothetical protein